MTGIEFLYGVVASVIAAFVWDRIASRIPRSNKFGSIDVQGIWIGKIPYDSQPYRNGYNIFKIVERKGNVLAYIENYTVFENKKSTLSKIKGIGIYSAPVITLAYQFDKNDINQTGVFIARAQSVGSIGTVLKATYCQFVDDHENGNNIKFLKKDYILYRAKMPFFAQLRVLFGNTYFKNNELVSDFYSSTSEHQI